MNDLRLLAAILQVGLVTAFVLGLGGAFIPGPLGTASAVGALAVLVGAPVLRVAWLTVDWGRAGDRRFAVFGAALLVVLAVSGVVAVL
jgi:hypothetical protein